jgi:NADH:ubiquinone oxidoreductase subunit 3 (subunit A)
VQSYVAVLALLGLLAAVILALYGVAFLAGLSGPVGGGPFLPGHRPQEHAVSRFHVRWYAVTMVFLAFDMEMVFMFPWALGRDSLSDYAGLARRSPQTALSLIVCLLGLVGMPPTAVFVGKLLVWRVLLAGRDRRHQHRRKPLLLPPLDRASLQPYAE